MPLNERCPANCCVVVLGDSRVGKTALIQRWTKNIFSENYTPTSFDKSKHIQQFNGITFKFDIWDTSGLQSYDYVRSLSYGEADVFLLVFSLIEPVSLYNVKDKWITEIRKHRVKAPIILCGTHSDVRDNSAVLQHLARSGRYPVTREQALCVASEIQALHYVETSALSMDASTENGFWLNDRDRDVIARTFEVCAMSALNAEKTLNFKHHNAPNPKRSGGPFASDECRVRLHHNNNSNASKRLSVVECSSQHNRSESGVSEDGLINNMFSNSSIKSSLDKKTLNSITSSKSYKDKLSSLNNSFSSQISSTCEDQQQLKQNKMTLMSNVSRESSSSSRKFQGVQHQTIHENEDDMAIEVTAAAPKPPRRLQRSSNNHHPKLSHSVSARQLPCTPCISSSLMDQPILPPRTPILESSRSNHNIRMLQQTEMEGGQHQHPQRHMLPNYPNVKPVYNRSNSTITTTPFNIGPKASHDRSGHTTRLGAVVHRQPSILRSNGHPALERPKINKSTTLQQQQNTSLNERLNIPAIFCPSPDDDDEDQDEYDEKVLQTHNSSNGLSRLDSLSTTFASSTASSTSSSGQSKGGSIQSGGAGVCLPPPPRLDDPHLLKRLNFVSPKSGVFRPASVDKNLSLQQQQNKSDRHKGVSKSIGHRLSSFKGFRGSHGKSGVDSSPAGGQCVMM